MHVPELAKSRKDHSAQELYDHKKQTMRGGNNSRAASFETGMDEQ